MKTLLKRKIFKGIPLWTIISLMITAGLGIAAISWISNQVNVGVTVSDWEIRISGPDPAFADMKVDNPASILYTYTINEDERSEGYLMINIIGDGTETLSDAAINWVKVTDGDGIDHYLQLITGYPILGGGIVSYYGATVSTPFDFGLTSGGTIELVITPFSFLISQIQLQATSGLP